MFRKIEDFERAWKYESEQTVKLFNELTDDSLNQKVSEEGRTLGFLAWHLAVTLEEMPKLVGLTIDAPNPETECPTVAKEIVSAFEKGANSVRIEVTKNWTDETLEIEDQMYGETWSRGMTLFYLIAHLAHHRGQITVLMRQAGLKIVGIYGPAKEEWAAMGMPALA